MKKVIVLGMLLLGCVAANMAYSQIIVELTSPVNGQKFGDCSDVPLAVNLDVQSGGVKDVRYYANGIQKGFNRKTPYDDVWEGAPNCIYEIYAKVTDSDGNEFYSESVYITVGENYVDHNICVNGEFSCGLSDWSLQRNEGAAATVEVDSMLWLSEGAGIIINIENGGSANWHVQLQQNFQLISGHSYEYQFMAEATEAKTIDVAFQQKADPYETYHNQAVTVDGANIYGPYTFDCTVDQDAAQFKFNVGGNTTPIMIDGVMIIDEFVSGVREITYKNGKTAETYVMSHNYPNPFNPETTIQYELSDAASVTIALFDIQGRQIRTLVSDAKSAGTHEVKWNGQDELGNRMPSGMYIYRVTAEMNHKTHQFSRKMLLVE